MTRRRYTSEQWQRLTELEERQAEQTLSENHGIPKHVQRNQLSIDDDPDLAYYNPDRYDE